MLLAIDTATRMLSLALHDGQRVVAEMSWGTANRHSVELVPAIQELCARAGVAIRTLTFLAVSQGPGSFSGLRIGVSAAKGLAMALRIPLIPVPTLDVVAAAQPKSERPLLAVAQAGRGRVCVGRYAFANDRWQPAAPVAIMSWEALLASIQGPVCLAGEIDPAVFNQVRDFPNIELPPPSLLLRRAGVLADIAWGLFRDGQTQDPAAVIPLYVNQPGVPHP